ncbi:hypothetical protein [Lelliottia amnigena]|uniref:hypothetical protein n=1 Tax=Lelliottia amnigena TaxID=61646 RepID=UPI00115A724F
MKIRQMSSFVDFLFDGKGEILTSLQKMRPDLCPEISRKNSALPTDLARQFLEENDLHECIRKRKHRAFIIEGSIQTSVVKIELASAENG